MGILQARVESFGRHGRTTVVKLLEPPATLCQELAEDLLVGWVAEETCGSYAKPHVATATP